MSGSTVEAKKSGAASPAAGGGSGNGGGSDPLASALVERHGFTPADAARALEAVSAVIRDELLRGGQVLLKDFATMKIVEKKAAIVKDPATGHQFITPAENVVTFVPADGFQKSIATAKLSSIVLAVPSNDTFARVIEFHFSRVGWRVFVVSSTEACVAHVKESGAHLVIIDHALEGSRRLVEELRCKIDTSRIPLIGLFPREGDPGRSTDFQVATDEHLVEPFEVYTLLMLAETELARSSEEEVIFDQQVAFQLGTTEANIERALEMLGRLLADSGMIADSQELLKAAAREALGNAAQHGNRDNPEKLIKVQYLLDKEKATVVVGDDGPGFDHERYTLRAQTKDAVSAARERHEQGRAGGLGIMLIQKCVDRVEYNDTGTVITLTKKLRPAAAAQ
jgi:anti-sigma regulatory factor (Ser/Thr protein kinase)/nucleoid DNA-binding protein